MPEKEKGGDLCIFELKELDPGFGTKPWCITAKNPRHNCALGDDKEGEITSCDVTGVIHDLKALLKKWESGQIGNKAFQEDYQKVLDRLAFKRERLLL